MPQLHAWAAEKRELSSMTEEEHCVISQARPAELSSGLHQANLQLTVRLWRKCTTVV